MTNEVRLTADNATPELIEQMVMENKGKLGAYEIKEFEALQNAELTDFNVEWRPFTMDRSTGLVKLVPKTGKGKNMLDRARAREIRSRPLNRGLSMYNAVGVVQATKRNKEANTNPVVVDFMIRHHANPDLLKFIEENDEMMFYDHIRTKLRDDFNQKQLRAIFELLGRVHEAMLREPPNHKSDSEAESGATVDATDTSDKTDPVITDEATHDETTGESSDNGEQPTHTHIDEASHDDEPSAEVADHDEQQPA